MSKFDCQTHVKWFVILVKVGKELSSFAQSSAKLHFLVIVYKYYKDMRRGLLRLTNLPACSRSDSRRIYSIFNYIVYRKGISQRVDCPHIGRRELLSPQHIDIHQHRGTYRP